METIQIKKNNIGSVENWFDEFIATLQTHRVMLETNTAGKELANFYETLVQGNSFEIANLSVNAARKVFVTNMILDYLKLVQGIHINKLAFDYKDAEVLVWVELHEENGLTEKKLYLAEAEVNAKYHKYGYYMTSMVVELSDHFSVPNHYLTYIA